MLIALDESTGLGNIMFPVVRLGLNSSEQESERSGFHIWCLPPRRRVCFNFLICSMSKCLVGVGMELNKKKWANLEAWLISIDWHSVSRPVGQPINKEWKLGRTSTASGFSYSGVDVDSWSWRMVWRSTMIEKGVFYGGPWVAPWWPLSWHL